MKVNAYQPQILKGVFCHEPDRNRTITFASMLRARNENVQFGIAVNPINVAQVDVSDMFARLGKTNGKVHFISRLESSAEPIRFSLAVDVTKMSRRA